MKWCCTVVSGPPGEAAAAEAGVGGGDSLSSDVVGGSSVALRRHGEPGSAKHCTGLGSREQVTAADESL